MRTKGWMALLLCFVAVACWSCASDEGTSVAGDNGPRVAADTPGDGIRCSRYNLHYYDLKGLNHASYANYTDCPGHNFLPYNTKFRASYWSKGFKLVAVDAGTEILFEYRSANMGGLSTKEYLDLIMSPTAVSYTGLSPVDEQGIKAGRAMVGMTKQGVTIALGYPAKHRTPSTDLNTWLYWKGRFNMLAVEFDNSGKVTSLH